MITHLLMKKPNSFIKKKGSDNLYYFAIKIPTIKETRDIKIIIALNLALSNITLFSPKPLNICSDILIPRNSLEFSLTNISKQ